MGVWRGRRRVADSGALILRSRARRRAGRVRWAAVVAATFVLLNVLAIGAYASSRFAPDNKHTDTGDDRAVPSVVRDGGPVLETSGGQVDSHRMPARTISLTFDDGPDPIWTPQVIRVLAKHRVPGTFFVIGAQVARHPDLVRYLVRHGHELGIHTFTHPQLADLPGWRRRLEYGQSQDVIAYITGLTTPLVRLPYSSGVNALDKSNWSVAQEAGQWGFVPVFNDTDSRDWARPGVDTTVRNASPEEGRGAVVTARRPWPRWTDSSLR